MVLEPEAFHSPPQHAALDLLLSVQIEQRVRDQPSVGAVALPEIGGELQALPAGETHSQPPIARPSAAAPSPRTMLASTFTAASLPRPSSPRRCVSSIHVENVVYDPIVAEPTSTMALPVSAMPVNSPSSKAP